MDTLALGYAIPLLGLTRDLHPLDNAHVERTTIIMPVSVNETGIIGNYRRVQNL